MRTILVSVLVIVQMLISSALAQPLADRIPADALIYVGWRGIDSMGPGYEQSHLKAVLDASSPESIFDQLIPQLIERLAEENAEAAGYVQLVADAARLMWRYPTALYIGPPELRGEMEPLPRIGLICQAGAEARSLAAKLNELLEQQGIPMPIEIKQHADRLVLSIGDTQALQKLADDPGAAASLADHPAFKRALSQAHGDPAAIMYIDLKGVLVLVDEVLRQVNPMAAMFWPQVSDTLGLGVLENAIWTAGFEGRDWGQHLFVAAPAPRSGLMAALVSDPVTDEIFAVVPKTAAMASVSRIDLSGLVGQIRTALIAMNPDFAPQFDQGKQQLTNMLGFDLDAELLGALGPQWAVYTDRRVAGTGTLGLAVVNPLRDAKAVERSLSVLGQLATVIVASRLQETGVSIEIRQTRVDGMTIHYLATPFITPAWGIKDGNLYMGLYPQVVSAAASYVSSGAPNLLANSDFRALRKRLGDVRPNSITFVDLPQTASDGYQSAMMMIRMYTGFADLFGMTSSPMLLPPLPKLLPHISPSGGMTWVDDRGYHMHSIEPFPGSGAMATQNNLVIAQAGMMVSIAPLSIGVMLPALTAARTSAREMTSNTQLRGIHQGCIFYAQTHDGRFPDDIGTLLINDYFTVEYTLSPMSDKFVPPGFDTWPDEQRRRWVNANTSYILVPGLREDGDPEKIVLFTKLQDSGGERISICWNDNHVTLEPIARANQLIFLQTGKSLEEWSGLLGAPLAPNAPPAAPR